MKNTFIHQNVWVKSVENDVYTVTSDGRIYLDMLNGAGCYFLWKYGDSMPSNILAESSKNLLSAMNYYNHESKVKLRNFLVDLTNYPLVFFACSGSEANDAALKLSMKYHTRKGKQRNKVLYPVGGLYGRTMGAVYCSQPSYHYFLPDNPNFIGFEVNNIKDFDKCLEDESVGTVMLEFLPTKSVTRWDDEVIKHILTVCKEKDINTITDEIKSGFGRTGRVLATHYWLEKFGIAPDIVTFGKALSAGLPMSGVLADWKFSDDYDTDWHVSSMGAQPIICDVSCYLLQPLFDKNVLKQVVTDGDKWSPQLTNLGIDNFHYGKWWTLLFPNKDAKEIAAKLREKNVLVYSTTDTYISLLPSLYFQEKHWKEFINKLTEVLK